MTGKLYDSLLQYPSIPIIDAPTYGGHARERRREQTEDYTRRFDFVRTNA